ncbi:adenylate kinase family protein [Lyticum sinuosum]|uniref:Adenylate kinase n=1 Tax=Lyticum sinuosum TaxID=1332059 RepID=A0AAE4VKE8_9RICK|nr:nucleoside monophosphate kinase [Lyticum sinuosum]MDZ5761427.1 adenylate kinase [Lyticum sinuosum]
MIIKNFLLNFIKKSLIFLLLIVITACSKQNALTNNNNYKDHKLYIIMIGAPSSGKGTHASIISKKYKIPHISVGDIMRDEVKSGSKLGREMGDIMQKGGLVPPQITMELINNRISQKDCRNGYILDGAPRSRYQAEQIKNILSKDPNNVNIILNLDVSDNVLKARMIKRAECGKCNAGMIKGSICTNCHGDEVIRSDDNPRTFNKRLTTYHKHSDAVIDYFKNHSNFIIVDIKSHGNVEEVSKKITNSIDYFISYITENNQVMKSSLENIIN